MVTGTSSTISFQFFLTSEDSHSITILLDSEVLGALDSGRDDCAKSPRWTRRSCFCASGVVDRRTDKKRATCASRGSSWTKKSETASVGERSQTGVRVPGVVRLFSRHLQSITNVGTVQDCTMPPLESLDSSCGVSASKVPRQRDESCFSGTNLREEGTKARGDSSRS